MYIAGLKRMTRIIMLGILLTSAVYLYIFSRIEINMRTIDKQVRVKISNTVVSQEANILFMRSKHFAVE
jgi:hypothetical protein